MAAWDEKNLISGANVCLVRRKLMQDQRNIKISGPIHFGGLRMLCYLGNDSQKQAQIIILEVLGGHLAAWGVKESPLHLQVGSRMGSGL